MFDLGYFSNLVIPSVFALCLIVGYVLKHWVKDLDNKLIPTLLALLGAGVACIINKSLSVDLIIAGSFSGLASTGFHEMFKQLIANKSE